MTVPQHENPPEQASTGEQDTSSILSDFDLYLFGQGKHHRIYEKMGAHACTVNGVAGGNFSPWGPNPQTVSVIGGFKSRHPAAHPKHLRHIDLGARGGFIPGLQIRAPYKDA